MINCFFIARPARGRARGHCPARRRRGVRLRHGAERIEAYPSTRLAQAPTTTTCSSATSPPSSPPGSSRWPGRQPPRASDSPGFVAGARADRRPALRRVDRHGQDTGAFAVQETTKGNWTRWGRSRLPQHGPIVQSSRRRSGTRHRRCTRRAGWARREPAARRVRSAADGCRQPRTGPAHRRDPPGVSSPPGSRSCPPYRMAAVRKSPSWDCRQKRFERFQAPACLRSVRERYQGPQQLHLQPVLV